ncbi:mlr1050 [Mesorhizobium japonicum MAFF 303099]|uniref:Mlr1050 protein n=1 Tax=Mesorhizobium japonicum (strain LMG 29417 / CECT 9101 / MAFF 303099) TaxID=266835 RepID=Q98LE9_RHILO|nr:mlr1050 [Mesorhizobium japonicum MAFF 303099]
MAFPPLIAIYASDDRAWAEYPSPVELRYQHTMESRRRVEKAKHCEGLEPGHAQGGSVRQLPAICSTASSSPASSKSAWPRPDNKPNRQESDSRLAGTRRLMPSAPSRTSIRPRDPTDQLSSNLPPPSTVTDTVILRLAETPSFNCSHSVQRGSPSARQAMVSTGL